MIDTDDSYYDDLGMHRLMLADRVRCEAYRQALAKRVKPGDVVLDVGAGTGVLSLFAAQAGARRVYAVERTGIVDLARQLSVVNGAVRRVRVVHNDMENAELPERVDVIVSEWMGGFGVDEGFLPAVVLARDRWLKPNGAVLPELVTAWMAPVWDGELEGDMGFWRGRPYDLDLSPIASMTANEVRYCRHHVTGQALLAEPQTLWVTDVRKCSVEEARSSFESSLLFTATREGGLNALAAWFHADFGEGIVLTNSPGTPETHWGRFVYPLSGAVKVVRGTKVSVSFACEPAVDGHCRTRWSVKVGDGVREHHESIN